MSATSGLTGALSTGRTLQGGMVDASGKVTYSDLPDKPQINGVELLGDKSSNQLDLQPKMDKITNTMIEELFK